AEAAGARPIAITSGARGARPDEPTDVVLYDPALGAPPVQLPGLHVPVVARGELADGAAALYGARAALGAIDVLGRAAERIAVGLGPAPREAVAELEVDRAQLDRQLGKLTGGMRVGDHETKTLLRAFGVAITRQLVATTPSAAVKAARRVRYPVELKPWGHDLPTEPAGCPVERGVTSDALVRRAYAAVLAAADRLATGAVIVREAPPLGRDLAVSIVQLPALGWTVVVEAGQIAAAPAPLRAYDADALAHALVSSRAGDPEPDRVGLANILRRASHLAVELGDRLVELELPRVIVGGRGSRSVVADAWSRLV
ncbi:MAG TPA: acetate--CoA ligase family protein, partial [Kofleriaceae bacterium]|nr:acetate--CoA ligase family protein [Kofleriaceae bacterium]